MRLFRFSQNDEFPNRKIAYCKANLRASVYGLRTVRDCVNHMPRSLQNTWVWNGRDTSFTWLLLYSRTYLCLIGVFHLEIAKCLKESESHAALRRISFLDSQLPLFPMSLHARNHTQTLSHPHKPQHDRFSNFSTHFQLQHMNFESAKVMKTSVLYLHRIFAIVCFIWVKNEVNFFISFYAIIYFPLFYTWINDSLRI